MAGRASTLAEKYKKHWIAFLLEIHKEKEGGKKLGYGKTRGGGGSEANLLLTILLLDFSRDMSRCGKEKCDQTDTNFFICNKSQCESWDPNNAQ